MKKLFAVLGDPIGHSMSPLMHNDLFSFYKMDAHYHPLQVKAESLEDAVRGLKAIGIAGFNVTVPHKSTIIPLLDGIDELAGEIGAVNTVVNENGKLIGYNTDGPGFLAGVKDYIPSLTGKKVLIIGAGGAARAIYFTLVKNGPQRVDVSNRTVEKALKLVNECTKSISSNALSLDQAGKRLEEYDIIVQTTMIGMYPIINEQPLSLSNLNENAVVYDIIYNPLETEFLLKAKQKGAKIKNGIDMFVYQGALAFEKWTGVSPDVGRMRQNVLKQLGGTRC
ncbi:shikimate dehydrogenase [Neobacillus sp. PS3-40]|uniref:shikimate dehydrogenase n=1 Tax=Neobacillus sp. PS3-40 TaxID=3070679 RepID=UPI0027DFDA1B|nr:shikimate dehydrogenase [Neobacillus sp. PS3-40]WML45381.1 shikimate dehydrogenase [Neobacillus sp. PS3-40]